jgi:hypothetical protein
LKTSACSYGRRSRAASCRPRTARSGKCNPEFRGRRPRPVVGDRAGRIAARREVPTASATRLPVLDQRVRRDSGAKEPVDAARDRLGDRLRACPSSARARQRCRGRAELLRGFMCVARPVPPTRSLSAPRACASRRRRSSADLTCSLRRHDTIMHVGQRHQRGDGSRKSFSVSVAEARVGGGVFLDCAD